jgi:LysM domain
MRIYNINRVKNYSHSPRLNSRLNKRKPSQKGGLNISFDKIFGSFGQNSFVFQLIGLGIITVAVFISFQTISADLITTAKAQSIDPNSDVHLYTNFKSVNEVKAASSSIIEIPQNQVIVVQSATQPDTSEGRTSLIIKSGDTLSSISYETKVSVAKLIEYNNILDAGNLKVGQELKLVQ